MPGANRARLDAALARAQPPAPRYPPGVIPIQDNGGGWGGMRQRYQAPAQDPFQEINPFYQPEQEEAPPRLAQRLPPIDFAGGFAPRTQEEIDAQEAQQIFQRDEAWRAGLMSGVNPLMRPFVDAGATQESRERLLNGESFRAWGEDIGDMFNPPEQTEGGPPPRDYLGEAAGGAGDFLRGSVRSVVFGRPEDDALVQSGADQFTNAVGDWWNDDSNELSRPARMGGARSLLSVDTTGGDWADSRGDDILHGYIPDFVEMTTQPWQNAENARRGLAMERARQESITNNLAPGESVAFDGSVADDYADQMNAEAGFAGMNLAFGIGDAAWLGSAARAAAPRAVAPTLADGVERIGPRLESDPLRAGDEGLDAGRAESGRSPFRVAVRDSITGEVVSAGQGRIHSDAHELAMARNPAGTWEDGFIDGQGRYYTRSEAMAAMGFRDSHGMDAQSALDNGTQAAIDRFNSTPREGFTPQAVTHPSVPDGGSAGAGSARLGEAIPFADEAPRRIEGPEGYLEYRVTPDGWTLSDVQINPGADGTGLLARLEAEAQANGSQVVFGRRHAPGSARPERLGSAPDSEWDGVFGRRGTSRPQSDPAQGSLNSEGAQAGAEAGTQSDFLRTLPTEPERWQEIMGAHPWINEPSRAQLIIMAAARNADGSPMYSLADIANVTRYSEGSANVLITRARDAGIPLPRRPRGVPGGDRLNDIVRVMESAERNGEYMTAAEIGERLGISGQNVDGVRAQVRGGYGGRNIPSDLLERFRRVDEAQAARSRRSTMSREANATRTDLPTTGYHATVANVDGPLIEGEGGLGRGAYHSTDPEIADWLLRDEAGNYLEGANIVPERLPALDRYVPFDTLQNEVINLAMRRGVNPDDVDAMLRLQQEVTQEYRSRGYVGISNPDYAGGTGELVTWDASNRRAPWARMSQRNRNSSDPFASVALPLAGATATGAALYSDNAEAGNGEGQGGGDWLSPVIGAGATAAGLYALTRGRGRSGARLGEDAGMDAAAQLRREERIGSEVLPHIDHLDDAERIDTLDMLRGLDEDGFDEAVSILRGDADAMEAMPPRVRQEAQADYETALRDSIDEMGVDEFDETAARWGVDPDAPNARDLLATEYLRAFPSQEALQAHEAAMPAATEAMRRLSPMNRYAVADQLGVDPNVAFDPAQSAESFMAPLPRDQRLNSFAGAALAGGGAAYALWPDGAEAASGRDDGEPLTAEEAIQRYGLSRDYFNSDDWITMPVQDVPGATDSRVVAVDGDYYIVESSGRLFKYHRFRDFDTEMNSATVNDVLVGEVMPSDGRYRNEPMGGPPQDWLDGVSGGESTLDDISNAERLGYSAAALLGTRTLLGRANPLMRDLAAASAAGTVDFGLGGDPAEASVVGVLGGLSSHGMQPLDNMIADAGAEWRLRTDPSWRAERDAFGQTLSDEAPRIRAQTVTRDPLDHSLYGEIEGVRGQVPGQEVIDQGWARDFPSEELSPRQQFLEAPPIEQQVWMRQRANQPWLDDWAVDPAHAQVTAPSSGFPDFGAPPLAAASGEAGDPFHAPRSYRVSLEDMMADPEGRGALLFSRAQGAARAADEMAAIADAYGVEVVRGPRGGVNRAQTGANLLRAAAENPELQALLRNRGLWVALMTATGASVGAVSQRNDPLLAEQP